MDAIVSYLALIGFSAVGKEGQLITGSHNARIKHLSLLFSMNGKVGTNFGLVQLGEKTLLTCRC